MRRALTSRAAAWLPPGMWAAGWPACCTAGPCGCARDPEPLCGCTPCRRGCCTEAVELGQGGQRQWWAWRCLPSGQVQALAREAACVARHDVPAALAAPLALPAVQGARLLGAPPATPRYLRPRAPSQPPAGPTRPRLQATSSPSTAPAWASSCCTSWRQTCPSQSCLWTLTRVGRGRAGRRHPPALLDSCSCITVGGGA